MSHEMLTPLNGVVGMTEALARTQLDPTATRTDGGDRFFGIDARSSDRRSDFRVPRRRRGADRSEAKTFRLGAAIRAMALPFGIEAAAKGVAFAVEVEPAADIQVTGDASSLGELLACLLSNAVKFTERGEVRIGVRRPARRGLASRSATPASASTRPSRPACSRPLPRKTTATPAGSARRAGLGGGAAAGRGAWRNARGALHAG